MVIDTNASQSTAALPGTLSTPAANAAATPKDQFMRLFVAQLQNQDPLDPQKGADLIAQLAQMTAVEQSAETNQHLTSLETGQSAQARSTMASMVGRTVHARASQITLPAGGTPVQIGVHVTGVAANVDVVITDQSGQKVRTIKAGAGTGSMPVIWDGKGDDGKLLPSGAYKVAVKATDAAGATISATPEITGVIDGVDFTNGNAQFQVGGLSISPADVLSISK